MKNTILAAAIFLAAHLKGQILGLESEHSFGGKVNDAAADIIQTPDGGFLIAGTANSVDGDFTGMHHGSSSTSDMVLIKMNADQSFAWSRSYGGNDNDSAFSVINTMDGGYLLAGSTFSSDGDIPVQNGNGDIVLMKLFSDGSIDWVQTYGGGNNESVRQVIALPDGFAVAGYSQSYNYEIPTTGDGVLRNNDAWIFTVDAMGFKKFERVLGGSESDYFNTLTIAAGGKVIAAGTTFSNDGWIEKQFGSGDAFVVQLSDLFDVEWIKTFGGSNFDAATSATVSPDNKYCFAGTSASVDFALTENSGSTDIWMFEVNDASEMIFQRSFGGSADESAVEMGIDAAGNYMIAGTTHSADGIFAEAKGENDYCILQVNASGELVYEKNYGGAANDNCNAMLLLADGTFMLAGATYSADGDIAAHVYSAEYSDAWYVQGGLQQIWYADTDHDGFGDAFNTIEAVAQPCFFVGNNSDCNDHDALIFPGATEICNSLDDNCDGIVDHDAAIARHYTTACYPETILLKATPGFETYRWMRNGVLIDGANGSDYNASESGIYSVIATSGIYSDTAITNPIRFYAMPDATISASASDLCDDGSIVLKTDKSKGNNYQWMKNNTVVAEGDHPMYAVTEPGTYRVVITNPAGCSAISEPVDIISSCRAADAETSNMEIYPNPAADSFHIQLNGVAADGSLIRIFNMNGEMMYQEPATDSLGNYYIRSGANWSDGVYSVIVTSGDKQLAKKIMIGR